MEQEEVTREWYASSLQLTRELGAMALRTLITLNSGGFVVLLTFVGNSAAQSAFSVPLISIQWSLGLFLLGIVLTFLVLAIAYAVALFSDPFKGESVFSDRIVLVGYFGLSFLALTAFIVGVINLIINVQLS
jgi:hypothetical protein